MNRYHDLIQGACSNKFLFKGGLVFLLSGLFCLGGCATQMAQITGEVSVPAKAAARKVIVVANDNPQNPQDVADLTRLTEAALRGQGFQVVTSEDQADLIILPFFTQVRPDENAGQTPSAFFNPITTGSMFDASGRVMGDASLYSQASLPTDSRVGLMITAIARDTWSSLPTDNTKVPRVWRVTATTTSLPGEEQKYSATLMNVSAPFFGKNTGGVIAEKILRPTGR